MREPRAGNVCSSLLTLFISSSIRALTGQKTSKGHSIDTAPSQIHRAASQTVQEGAQKVTSARGEKIEKEISQNKLQKNSFSG
jgi:hypothetical protein